ncbi:MAG: PEGA domain-containing protein [bacterium]|nr:MAG: PEGA domain-containing protein [bacterium]
MRPEDDDTFQMIHNPYIVGNPIEDRRMFFGREDDFEYIRKKVTGATRGGLIVLCGTRRSGKTSILFQIKGGRLGESYIPILIDMQSMTVENDHEFLESLAREVTESIGDPEIIFERDFTARATDNPYAAFQILTERIGARLGDRKLVLMFDEYELFETHIDKNRFSTDILNALAGWMEHRAGVFIIFTGSDKLEARNPRYWEHFLGKALHRRISFLSEADTMRLIRDPVRDSVSYDEDVPEEIYSLTAGQPFYTQVLCQSLVDHLNEKEKNRVTQEDVREVTREIIENPLPQMIFSWTSLSALEKVSISIIAELSKEDIREVAPDEIVAFSAEEKIGYQLDGNKVRETVERLFYHDLLEKNARGDTYTFKMDLWRLWMARMHSIWQVINEIGGSEEELEEGLRPVGKRFSRTRIIAVSSAVIVVVALLFLYQIFFRAGVPGAGGIGGGRARDSTVVTVRTQPAQANIFIGEQWIGRSPVERETVAARHTTVRAELSGYQEYIDSVELVKNEPFERMIVLEELRGNLHVTTDPPGARIVVDGEDSGSVTPDTLTGLSVNQRYDIDLRLSGYSSRSFQGVSVYNDSMVALHHSFSKLTHPLTVDSEPAGAVVYLDGRKIATAPTSLASVSQGEHVLELRLEGFRTERSRISIPAPNNRVRVTLGPLPPGTLVFQITPYAEIWINGELIEESAVYLPVELAPGTYRIELRHPSYETVERTVEVKSGQTVPFEYSFAQESERQ